MKLTVATIAAAVATGAFAQPEFINSDIEFWEAEPFTLMFRGCENNGCTITLQIGPSAMDLSYYRTLTTDATGDSLDATLGQLVTAYYNFKIVDNGDGSYNYSTPFYYRGTRFTSSDLSGSTATTNVPFVSSASSPSGLACCSDYDSTASIDASPTGFVGSTRSSQLSGTANAEASSGPPHNAGSVIGFSPFGVIGAGVAGLYLVFGVSLPRQ